MTDYPEIASPARTQAILNKYHLRAKKSLGQNFLIDLNILHKIIETAGLTKNDNVIEIGPGIGGLTEQLAKVSGKVLAFEIDENLLPVLADTLYQYDNVEIINEDILKANLPKIIDQKFSANQPVKVVGNLPYYITTPIVMNLLASNVSFESITVMMQKEVAERLTSKPNNKSYGSLSVIIQQSCDVEVSFIVPKTAFIPQPAVDSAIVKISKKNISGDQPFNSKRFAAFVRGCFMHRRKTLRNNLQGFFGKTADTKSIILQGLTDLAIKPEWRPEQLSVSQFISLTNKYHELGILR